MGVVLAGGKSSRMGTDKAELPHPQQPVGGCVVSYLQHAVIRLRPLLSTIAISGRSENVKAVADVIVIPDSSPHQGPVVGVAESLRHADELGLAGIFVTPVDMPYVETEDLRRLMNAWQAQRTGFPIVVATFADQQPEPLLAIYPMAMRSAIESLAQSNNRSLSRWLMRQAMIAVPLPQSVAKNVNRPEDIL